MPTNNSWNSQNPAQVAKGGTGISTTTAYAPICGGTTATGAFQTADSGISTSGRVLTSGGAGALPTWVDLPAAKFPITPFVVGPVGLAGYQTIQAALDAAHASGGGVVYVQPGIYTENLIFYPTTQIVGTTGSSYNAGTGGTVEIDGVHTPPLTGYIAINNCYLSSATDIFFSAAAGSASIVIENSQINCTAGYTFNLVNWTGLLGKFAVQEASTTNGVVNNTGGAQVFFQQSNIGAGSVNPMIVSGQLNLYQCEMYCPITLGNGTNAVCSRASFNGVVTAQDVSSGDFRYCQFSTGSDPAFYQGSTGAFNFVNCSFDSTNSPCIDGVGSTGTLTLATATFPNNAIINPLLVTAGGGGFIPGNFGTAGQVLTSNGLGVVPSWKAGGGGGSPISFQANLTSTFPTPTGDGTPVKVIFDAPIQNVGNGYDYTTGIFTAPVSGLYFFNWNLNLAGINPSTMTSIVTQLVASGSYNLPGRTIIGALNPTSGGQYCFNSSGSCYLLATQTAYVQVYVTGGSATVTIGSDGAGYLDSNFSGFLIS